MFFWGGGFILCLGLKKTYDISKHNILSNNVLFGPGGHTIKMAPLRTGNDILEDKFQALVNINASVPIVQVCIMRC